MFCEIALLWLCLLATSAAPAPFSKPLPAPPRRAPLTEAAVKWVRDGEGKRTTAQVVAKLGPPDRYEHIDFTYSSGWNWVEGDVQMVWEDRSELYPVYQAKQLTHVIARYRGVPTFSSLAPESSLKLRLGMSPKTVSLATCEKNVGGWSSRLLRLVVHGRNYAVCSYPETYKEDKLLNANPLPVLPELNRKLAADLQKKKRTVTDLLKQLGRPDRIELPHDGKRGPKGSTALTWEDVTEVEAVFENGRTVRLVGQFSLRLPHPKVTIANFRKLNHGSTPGEGRTIREVQNLFGSPVEEVERVEMRGNMANSWWQKVQSKRYGTRHVLDVFIDTDGKVIDARLTFRPKP